MGGDSDGQRMHESCFSWPHPGRLEEASQVLSSPYQSDV